MGGVRESGSRATVDDPRQAVINKQLLWRRGCVKKPKLLANGSLDVVEQSWHNTDMADCRRGKTIMAQHRHGRQQTW